jgi:hypothetical protein
MNKVYYLLGNDFKVLTKIGFTIFGLLHIFILNL